MKRVLKTAVSIVMAMAVALTANYAAMTANAATTVAEIKTIYDVPAELSGKTIILHSNDVHGALGRYAYIASAKQNFQARGAEVILVDAGDYSQGTPYVSNSKGLSAVESMNAAGYDIATVGNHEFDYGLTQLKSNLAVAKFKTVCASVFDGNGNSVFVPNTMYTTKSGLKLGFFGVITPETRTKSNPLYVRDLTFLTKDALYACGQQQIDTLKGQGADLVVCLSHLGVGKDTEMEGFSSNVFLNRTKGIDILIDGHSHTVMSAEESVDPITSTGTKLQTLGVVVIDDATKSVEDSYLISLDGLQKEVVTDAVTTKIIKEVNREYDVVYAQSLVDLNGERNPGTRTEETNMGDLIADAMLWMIIRDSGSVTVDPSHMVALNNGGIMRASIKAGSVTKKDICTVLPFGDTVCVIYVTGEQLLEALEASTFCTPNEIGGFPQVSGIKFTIDTGRPFAAGPTYPASSYHKPASINRVTIESINGQPFSKTDTYAVVTNNFIAEGGDTYYSFAASGTRFDTGILIDEAVIEYVKAELGGVIGTEYATPRGDITIK